MSKVWFITGAGSGLGTGIARAALRAGDRVVATGRSLEKVRKAYPDAAEENIVFVLLDVADETQAKAAVDEAVKRFGRIDVLVNNAGYSLLGNFEQMTTVEIQQQFAPNFYGVVHGMQAALPVMRRQRSGHIFNISSVAGVVGLKHCAAYAATKFAVEGLSLSVATEVEKFGIKITVSWPSGLIAPTCRARPAPRSGDPTIPSFQQSLVVRRRMIVRLAISFRSSARRRSASLRSAVLRERRNCLSPRLSNA